MSCPNCNKSKTQRGTVLYIVSNEEGSVETFKALREAVEFRKLHGGQILKQFLPPR